MPQVAGYGKKRKAVKRRKFVPRARNPVANKTGADMGTQRGFLRVLSGPTPFPTGMRRSHTYCEMFTLTTGTGVYGTQQAMRLNSVYDPNYTAGGHQPYGFDTMITIYDEYRVDKAHFQILFTTPGATNDILCAAAVNPNTSQGLTGANLNYVVETPSCTFGQLSSSGDRRCILRGSIDLYKLCGVSRAKYEADDSYSGTSSTNPQQEALLNFAIACFDGTGSVACQVQCIVTYDVWWFNRRALPAS